MREGPDDLILVYLRRIDGKIDRLTDDVQDLKPGSTASSDGSISSRRLHPNLRNAGPWADIARTGADQDAALVLLDRMGDPADGAAEDEYRERRVPRQRQRGGGSGEGKIDIRVTPGQARSGSRSAFDEGPGFR